jgi:6-O-methylguanine DNA methyltransferase, DNA binding domain
MKASQLPQDPWSAKLNVKKLPKRVKLDKDFAGIKAGSMLFVGTPQIIDAYMRTVPQGETRTIERMRRELARKNKCDATCPVSTAIFMRISAQAAIKQMDKGAAVSEVTPFWRVIEAGSTIGNKLTIDSQRLAWLRESEQSLV